MTIAKTGTQQITYSIRNSGIYTLYIKRNVNGSVYTKDTEKINVGSINYIDYIMTNRTTINLGEDIWYSFACGI